MKQPPLLPTYPIASLRELVLEAVERYGDKPALSSKREGTYQPTTYHELGEKVRSLSTYLHQLGLKKGDHMSVIGENRTEWGVAYLAAVASGLVVVPIDRDLKEKEILGVLKVAEPRVLICSQKYLGVVGPQRKSLPFLKTVVSIDPDPAAEMEWDKALAIGETARKEGDKSFEEAEVGEADVATIIFTSGTTGGSKGVMLTHGNLASNVVATSKFISINDDSDVLLSVLPLHHTYECTGGFLLALYQGSTVCYAENLRRVVDNLQETQASIMLGVPLLFTNMYRRIQEGIRQQGAFKANLARFLSGFGALFLGQRARRLVYKKVHEKFGGRLRLFISGGAALDPKITKGFRDLGITLVQGYGMTELSPIISVNRVGYSKDASVGPALPGVEVKIDQDEILVRGPLVMKGYFQNPEATQEVMSGDWLRTGDLGFLDAQGFLHINGRKKSVIVTPNGKNVYPEELEFVLNESPFVLESLVWGGPDPDPAATEVQAILVPDRESFDQEFGADNYSDEKIQTVLAAEVKKSNRDLANYKRVKNFTVRNEEFEKTTTKKIKRFLYT